MRRATSVGRRRGHDGRGVDHACADDRRRRRRHALGSRCGDAAAVEVTCSSSTCRGSADRRPAVSSRSRCCTAVADAVARTDRLPARRARWRRGRRHRELGRGSAAPGARRGAVRPARFGLSEPNLDCHEVNDGILADFQSVEPFDAALDARRLRQACRDRLVDMASTSTRTTAKRVRPTSSRCASRSASSNGTCSASPTAPASRSRHAVVPGPDSQRAARQRVPDRRGQGAAFVDGADRALQQLTDGCLADPACAAAYPTSRPASIAPTRN